MDLKLFIIFIALNAANVIIQTAKSLITVKGGKMVAAIANAIAYGLYTVVIVYMVCELPLWLKVITIASCNFVGVYIVKFFEEKLKKDKLWKVEATISPDHLELIQHFLNEEQIPYNYIDINKYVVLNIYCESQKDSASVREVLNYFHAKYFVIEARTSLL